MKASVLFREVNEILRKAGAIDCDIGIDHKDGEHYITVIVNGEYQVYDSSWGRII